MGHGEALRRALARRYGVDIPAPTDSRPPLPTGYQALDAALGGGLPRGRIAELTGDGALTLALGAVAAATRDGGLAALIDPARAFYPPSAQAAGVALDRLLVVQPEGSDPALDAIAVLLQTEGFALVVYDPPRGAREPTGSQLARLAGAASHAGALLLVLGAAPTERAAARRPLAYFATVRLLVGRQETLWRSDATGRPLDLAGYRLDVVVAKHKLDAPGGHVGVEVAPWEGASPGGASHRLPLDPAPAELGAPAEPAGPGEPAADRRQRAG